MKYFLFRLVDGRLVFIRAKNLQWAEGFVNSSLSSPGNYEHVDDEAVTADTWRAAPGSALFAQNVDDDLFQQLQIQSLQPADHPLYDETKATQDEQLATYFSPATVYEGGTDTSPNFPVTEADPDADGLQASSATAPDPWGYEMADPVAGFLKGIGFQTGTTPTAYGQYRRGQFGPTFGAFQANALQNFASPAGNIGNPLDNSQGAFETFANRFQAGGPVGQNLGVQALNDIQALSAQGAHFRDRYPTRDVGTFINPLNSQELQGQNLANLMNAGARGAGLSPLVFGNISRSGVQDLYSDWVGQNPTAFGPTGTGATGGNFMNYLSQMRGLPDYYMQ